MGTIRDALWLWGTKVNTLSPYYGFPESRMTIGGGLRSFGIDQAMMCGLLPPTEDEHRPVAGCRRLLWEMSFDEGFAFERPLAPIIDLHRAHPNVEGVLLDDFTTTEINRGARPEVLARMRAAMPATMKLWIVAYSMSLRIPDLADYFAHADGISFWVWNARELPGMAEYVARCSELSGGKPTVLGAYMYDFGEQKPLAAAQMEAQVETGIELVRGGACEGMCFLASSIMDIGLEAVGWTRGWIARCGDEPI